ncbi:MAG: SMC family ATPase, partial [Clostridia bacterium]|nr:SMC family ATPase [Clostridia bacterium]
MKPIKLEFVAFGPYKDKQVIDFEKIGNGVFAITGPTGAGKTTIFDALMYALFDEVSAKEVDAKHNPVDANSVRNKGMMRCQFADPSDVTEVRLEFEENGKRGIVKRTIRVSKKGDLKYDSELVYDGQASKGNKEVTAVITKLLGDVNATRFRQIVMLAQGQFRAFMESKDEQRKEILGKLFDSTPYKLFQERLGRVKRSLEAKQADQSQRLRNVLLPTAFFLPDGADACRYSADLPPQELENNLTALIASDDELDAKMSADVAALNKTIAEQDKTIGAAVDKNKRYGEMVEAKEHLAELEAEEARWAAAEHATKETARALHDVKPVGDEVARLSGER